MVTNQEEINKRILEIKKEEGKISAHIEAVDNYMKMLSEEDIDTSFTRKKPELDDFKVDIDGNTLSYEGNTNRKQSDVKLPLTKAHIEEINYCFNHPIYTIRNYVKIVSQDEGIINFKLYDYQANFIQTCYGNKRIIAKFPRQSGKTTTSAAFMLMYAMFNKDKTIAVVANKQNTAVEILDRIKLMYDLTPQFLKPGISVWNKLSITFENGCKIMASATSSSSIRGMSISLLYLDEFAFIQKNMISEFIESTFPVISSSKLARIIITSTPNGKNTFYKFYMDAVKGVSDFIPLSIEWNDVPGRDDEWREKMIRELGSIEKFNQEFGGDFSSESGMVFTADTVRHIEKIQVRDHLYQNVKMMNGLKVFERPVNGRKYLIACDVAGGKGRDSSTMVVFDISARNQYNIVATYQNNRVSTQDFPDKILNIALYYHKAFLIIENNGIGDSVVNRLWYDLEYENIFSSDMTRENKSKKKAYHEIGIRTNRTNKTAGVLYLVGMLDKFKIHIPDIRIVDEMYSFIKHPGTGRYAASAGNHDDFIMNLVLFAYIAQSRDSFELLRASYVDINDEDYTTDVVFYVEGSKSKSNKREIIEQSDESLYNILMGDQSTIFRG